MAGERQLSVVASPRNHLFRTFERSRNLSARQRQHLYDVSRQSDNVVTVEGVPHLDAFDKCSEYLCCFRARFGIIERTEKIRDLLSVDIGELGMEAGAGGGAVATDALSSICPLLQLQQFFLKSPSSTAC